MLRRLERDLSELREFSSIEQSCFEQQGRALAAALEAEKAEGRALREGVMAAEAGRAELEAQVRALLAEREQSLGQIEELKSAVQVRLHINAAKTYI